MKLHTIIFFLISISLFLGSCESNQNHFLGWTQSIPQGSSITEVKEITPKNFKVSWDKIETVNENLRVYVWVEENEIDIMTSTFFIEFDKNEKFISGHARK